MRTVEFIIQKTYRDYKMQEDSDPVTYGVLTLVYSDGTWENIFVYEWTDPRRPIKFNICHINGKTREEAFKILEEDYFKKGIEGHFLA